MGTKKLNVAIVLEATLGGTRKHVVDLLRHLPPDQYDVTFVYSTKRADERFKSDLPLLKESGVRMVELPMTRAIYKPANVYAIVRLFFLLRSLKIDVLHLHGAVAGVTGRTAALLNRSVKRIVYSPHGGVMHKIKGSALSRLFVLIEKMLVNRKVLLVAVSSDEKEKIGSLLGIEQGKIKLVPNGIDTRQLREQGECSLEEIQKEKIQLNLREDEFVLLYPALFLEAKGHLSFFETFVKHQLTLNPRIKILLAGDGPLRARIQELVEKTPFQKQVLFLGFVENINLYYQLADAVLLPSVNEAFGYVLLEAMAFKKPIFATRIGGIKDIVEDKVNGFLYDLNKMPDMIADINDYNRKLQSLGKACEQATELLLQRFDIASTSKQIKLLYLN